MPDDPEWDTPTEAARESDPRIHVGWLFLVLLLSPVAIFAVMSAMASGSFLTPAVIAIFPYAAISAITVSSGELMISLALLQFPAYAIIITTAGREEIRRRNAAIAYVCIAHVLAIGGLWVLVWFRR